MWEFLSLMVMDDCWIVNRITFYTNTRIIESQVVFSLLLIHVFFIYLTFIGAGIVELRRFEHQNPVGWAGPVEDAETAVGRVDVTAGRHDVPISPPNPRNLSQKWQPNGEIRIH